MTEVHHLVVQSASSQPPIQAVPHATDRAELPVRHLQRRQFLPSRRRHRVIDNIARHRGRQHPQRDLVRPRLASSHSSILTWHADQQARQALEAEYFGKRVLFTDRRDWPAAVIAAYRSQADAEAGFRQLKDPRVVSFSPMFHWTEQKIRVHAFYCVLALTIAHLMRRQATRARLDLSVRELLHAFAGIGETVMIYPSAGGRPKARRLLTDMDPTAAQLFEIFDLRAYAPRA